MTPAPHPEGSGPGARSAAAVPSPHPRDRPASRHTAGEPGHLAPTGTDGPLPDLVGFTPEELRVVAAVVALGPALAPSPSARERMRVRVLATASTDDTVVIPALPRTTATGDAGSSVGVPEVVELAGRRRRAAGVRGRFLVAAAAALCLVVALSGISLVLSRDALPGDALYSLKRAGESTQLQLTFSDTDRGLRHLDYAGRRVDELAALVERGRTTALGGRSDGVALAAVDQVDPATAASLLEDLDSEAASGSSLLTAVGVAGDPTALASLSTWAQGQSARLTALRPQLPPDAQTRTDSSLTVLDQVRARADTLAARLSCSPITTGGSDDLGPLPAATACSAPDGSAVLSSGAPTRPTTTTTPVGSPTTAGSPQGGSAAPSAPAPGGAAASGSNGPGPTTGAVPSGVATTVPALPTTPHVPLPVPSAPALPLPPLPTISVPVPLLPPITIGPILPGLPPITIGG